MSFAIINVIGVIIDALITLTFFRMISRNAALSRPVIIELCVLVTAARSAVEIWVGGRALTALVLFFATILLSFTYKMPMIKRLLLSTVLLILFILSDVLIDFSYMAVSNMVINELRNRLLFRVQEVLISKFVMFVIVKIFGYFIKPSEIKLPWRSYISLFILPVTTLLITYVFWEYSYRAETNQLSTISALAVVFLIASNIIVFYLFEYQVREAENRNREKLIEQQLSYKAEYYKELAERQKVSNKALHDLKNQMFALREIFNNDPKKCSEIFENISKQLDASEPLILTENESVDALVYAKKQDMIARSIAFTYTAYISKKSAIEPFDMCTILGNVLDNAIEANEKVSVEKRFISLDMAQRRNYLSIHVSNPVASPVVIEGNRILTTKKEKELHGFGLQSIKEVAEKYNGSYSLRQNDNEFHVYIMLQSE